LFRKKIIAPFFVILLVFIYPIVLDAARIHDNGKIIEVIKSRSFLSEAQINEVILKLNLVKKNHSHAFNNLLNVALIGIDLEPKTKQIAKKYGFLNWDGTLNQAVAKIIDYIYG